MALIILVAIGILIYCITKLDRLDNDVHLLNARLSELEAQGLGGKAPVSAARKDPQATKAPDAPPSPEKPVPLPPDVLSALARFEASEAKAKAEEKKTEPLPWKAPPVLEPAGPSWTDKIDWEMFAGVKLLGWIGGFVLFLAACFFVKYSMDQGLITPAMRVTIGFLLGAGCIVGGLLLRKKNIDVTVQTLCAAGVAVLYADIFAAHSFYQFVNAGATFAFMTLVTATAFLLAVRLSSRYVAYLGLVGGFLTPVVLSTGVDRPLALFSYIALLDIGLIAVALRCGWDDLVVAGFCGTALMQFGWTGKFFAPAKVMTGLSIYTFFPILFAAVERAAARKSDRPLVGQCVAFGPVISSLFGLFLMSFSELAIRPGLVFGFLLLINLVSAAQLYFRDDLEGFFRGVGGLSFFTLLLWTVRSLTPGLLLWGLIFYFAFGVVHAVLPAIFPRRRKTPDRWGLNGIGPLASLVLILIAVLTGVNSFWVWPFILVVALVALGAAAMAGVLWISLVTLGLVVTSLGAWLFYLPDAAGLSGLFVLLTFFALVFFGAGLLMERFRARRGDDDGPHVVRFRNGIAVGDGVLPDFLRLPSMAGLFPYALLAMALTRFDAAPLLEVGGVAALMTLLLLALVRYRRWDTTLPVALGGAAVVETVWVFHQAQPETWAPALALVSLFFALFSLFPFLFRKEMENRSTPWLTAAAAGPIHFVLAYHLLRPVVPAAVIGLVPAVFAILYLSGVMAIVKTMSAKAPVRPTALAGIAGVALFFISLIFPIQFDKQWITIGWALEGAALVWLYRRIEHSGLKMWGAALLAISFVRLALNPAVLSYHARSGMPILNWYLYAYGAVIAALIVAALLWRPKDELAGPLRFSAAFFGGAAILAFLLLNIEIADFFSAGPTLTFQFSGNLARDMAYSLGWSAFALAMMIIGMKAKKSAPRYAGLALLFVTVGKLFLHDLMSLSQLYRVGAFVGLSLVLIVASFLYQRFVGTTKEKDHA